MKKLSVIAFLIGVFCLIPNDAEAQQYASSEYYLIDSLSLDELEQFDKNLVDSCLKLYYMAEHDTSKINAINIIVDNGRGDNFWSAYNKWIYLKVKKVLANNPSPDLEIAYLNYLSTASSNMGYYYDDQGDIEKALLFYHKGLKIQERLNDGEGLAVSLNNIGMVYQSQSDSEKALEYYYKSLTIREELGLHSGIANSLNNIGNVHYDNGDKLKALGFFRKAINIQEQFDLKEGITFSLNNIGVIYYELNYIDSALYFFNRSRIICIEEGNKVGEADALNNIGTFSFERGDIKKALICGNSSMDIAVELGFPEKIRNAAKLLTGVTQQFQ